MSDLLALAERCEAAVDWDAGLDDDIWRAVFQRGNDETPAYEPHYTASVNAAMTLVSVEAGVRIERMFELAGARWDAVLHVGAMPVLHFDAERCCSAALAICAAALRARAASTPSLNAEIAGMGEGR